MVAAAALCIALAWVPVASSQENGENIHELFEARLELPENWQALDALPDSPLRLGLLQENEALLLGGAIAQANQAITLFSLREIPLAVLDLPVDLNAKGLAQLSPKAQDKLRDRLEKYFTADLLRLTPFNIEQCKTMLASLNGQSVIMLTARCSKEAEALIVNQVYYFPSGRVFALTFVSPPSLISIIAADIAYILEHFAPETEAGAGSNP